MRSSLPEEMLRLALELILERPADVALTTLTELVQMLCTVSEVIVSDSYATKTPLLLQRPGSDGSEEVVLDISALLQYAMCLQTAGSSDKETIEGSEPMILLMLEFVLEVLEHKVFHKSVVLAMETSSEAAQQLRTGFLNLAENLLQVI